MCSAAVAPARSSLPHARAPARSLAHPFTCTASSWHASESATLLHSASHGPSSGRRCTSGPLKCIRPASVTKLSSSRLLQLVQGGGRAGGRANRRAGNGEEWGEQEGEAMKLQRLRQVDS